MSIEGFQIKSILNYVLDLESPQNTTIFLIALSSIFILTIGRELFLYKQGSSSKLNLPSITLKVILSIAIGYILLLIFSRTPYLMFFAVLASNPISELLFNRYFSNTFQNISNEPELTQEYDAGEYSNITDETEYTEDVTDVIDTSPPSEIDEPTPANNIKDVNLNAIKNPDLDNILDLLVIYNYISTEQRRKLYEETLFLDNPEDEISRFLEMPILTKDELDEIKAIKGLIKLEGRLVSKEEAIVWLLKVKGNNSSLINRKKIIPRKINRQRDEDI